MKSLENFSSLPNGDQVKKEINLEDESNLSPDNLRYRHLERDIKISDMDGISEFSESPDGLFISYTTGDKNKLKVFDKKAGSIKTLHEASGQPGDYVINGTEELKTFRHGNEFMLGYSRQGKFIIQKLSHNNQPGEIIFEEPQKGKIGSDYLLSKNGRNLISQDGADELDFCDLESGAIEKIDLGFYVSKIIDSEYGSRTMAFSSHALEVFDKDEVSSLKKMEFAEIASGAGFLDDDNFVLSKDEKLLFYSVDKGDYQKTKEIDVGFRSDKIIPANGKKHLFCHSFNSGGFFVVEIETGKVISKIETEQLQQNWKGEIIILNKDGAIEEYHLGNNPERKTDRTQKILIAEDALVYGQDEYSLFSNAQYETIKGLSWNHFENLISRKLDKEGKFKWGGDRIYLEIPLSDFDAVKDLAINIATKGNIPIQFKFVNQEKSDPGVMKENTRFILNFKDIEDAKKFYNFLSEDKTYQSIIPDREHDYYGYALDAKAHYAFGYTEHRNEDQRDLEKLRDNFIDNQDGTFTSKTIDPESGNHRVYSSEEYERFFIGKDPIAVSKEKWEEK